MQRVAPTPLSPPSPQRRSSRSSDPRRLSGVQARRSSADWFHFDPRTAFDPHAPFLKFWHHALLLAITYQCFLLPYAVVFLRNEHPQDLPSLLRHDAFCAFYATELLFIVDFYVKLNTGFYKDGNMFQDASRSRTKYLTSMGFLLDIVAVVPLGLIIKHDAIGVATPWLEFHKFLRLWRVPQYFATLEDLYARFFGTLKMSKVAVVTAFVAHVLTCARVSFGFRDESDLEDQWRPLNDTDGNLNHGSVYLKAFFWTFGLLTGVYDGDLPRRSTEFVFTIVVLLAGFSLFSYLCSVFFVLSKSEQEKGNATQARLQQLKHLLSYYRVPQNLQNQAVEYIKRYHTDAESNDREVIKMMCPSIAKDIQVELLRHTVGKIPLFKGCNVQFIVALTSLLEMVSLPADFQLFAAGDPGDCMYVVSSGLLHILVNGKKVRELRSGSFFGEVSVFSKRPRSATVVTTSYSTVYKLSRFHIERVLDGYPQYAESISLAVDTILSQHPTTGGNTVGSELPQAPSHEEFLLTTLFQDSDGSESSAGTHLLQKSYGKLKTDRRKLTHKRSWGSPNQVKNEETKKKSIGTKRPQIGRSKSAQNVSIARREQLSMLSRRSEREKTEGGITDGVPLDAESAEAQDKPDPTVSPSPTYVPAPKLVKRSQSFFFKRKTDDAAIHRPLGGSQRHLGTVDAMQSFYDNFALLLNHKRERRSSRILWLTKLLLRKPITRCSRFRRIWLVMIQVVMLYHWVMIPLMLGFEIVRTLSAWYFRLPMIFADVVLWVDIYVTANLEIGQVRNGDEAVFDTYQIALLYVQSRAFRVDVLCVLPYAIFGSITSSQWISVALYLPRLGKVWRLPNIWYEWRMHLMSTRALPDPPVPTFMFDAPSQLQYLIILGFGVSMALHVVACGFFGLTQVHGFGKSFDTKLEWLPNANFDAEHHNASYPVSEIFGNQYSRALFYAATTITTLGQTVQPETDLELASSVFCMGLGLLLSALLADSVHTKFTAATVEQKDFLVIRARIQSFLRSQNAPADIMQRVNAFLDFWWSSHRGAIAREVLQDLPESIKREIIRSMCAPAVQTLALLQDVRPVLSDLEKAFVDSVDFILYGQGEIIYRQGDYASGLFFLLDGEVCMITDGNLPRSIPKGGFFGTASLHLSESSVSYAERMTAISGCVLLFVSREHLHAMHKTFPTLSMALKALEKRVIDSKLARTHALESRRASLPMSKIDSLRLTTKTKHFPLLGQWFPVLFQSNEANDEILFDPDSINSEIWQLWIGILIVFESFKVIYEACFGVKAKSVITSEAVTVLCEIFFAIDMFFCARLGYYEYGNKIMDRTQMKRRYYHSISFFVDVIAIVPLFPINWVISVSDGSRVEMLNFNKLSRLIRVKGILASAEAQYLNHTLEIRIVKIVYYTALLVHTLGCVWFSFGVSRTTDPSWAPDSRLEYASRTEQYLSAIFWSFGVMTASTTTAIPENPSQSLFAVVTMVAGLGLFAYVVGNLTDVVELRGADTREFNAQLASLRHLLQHFALPENLENKLKTYVFFQRFHSITQEHVLESCLPPSLLTDIRLVHLQPMIVKVAFLAGMDSSVTRMLVSQFLQVLIVKGEHVCRYGDHGSDMFFVFTGVVDVLVPASTLHRLSSETASSGGTIADAAKNDNGETSGPTPTNHFHVPSSSPNLLQPTMKKVNELTGGSYFGEIALFTNKPRTATTLARTSCVLYKLSRRSLELVFERYPEWKKRVLRIVSIQQEQQHLRNLYMAEQQHDTGNDKTLTNHQNQALRSSAVHSMSPRRLSERLAQSSKRLVRGMSSKRDGPDTRLGKVGTETTTPPQRQFFQPGRSSSAPATSHQAFAAPQLQAKKNPATSPLVTSELWIDKLLQCTEVQSPSHVLWLQIVTVATLFMAVAIPFQVSFDIPCYRDADGKMVHVGLPMITRALGHVCELVFAWDVWVNWNIKESLSSMELYETKHRDAYQKQRRLLWDALAAIPFDHFIADFYESPWLKLNRCLKIINFQHYVDEIFRRSVLYEQTRFVSRWLLFLVVIYWSACAYFIVAQQTATDPSNSWDQWSPPADVLLDDPEHYLSPITQLWMRIARSVFFAVSIFVKKGKTFAPDNETQLLFTIAISFVGFLIMGIMVGEVVNLYVSYISNEVEFRHHHLAVRKYLERWFISPKLRRRAHAFLSSLWSSHRGVNYQAILEDIPPEIRSEIVLHVGNASLEGFISKCFSPFVNSRVSTKNELETLMHGIAQHLKYEGFPRDESVITEGSIVKEMYFVVKGLLVSHSSVESTIAVALLSPSAQLDGMRGSISREVQLTAGDYFGDKGVLGYAVSRYVVRTIRACDLLTLTSEALLEVLLSRPLFQTVLGIAVESYREMTSMLRQRCSSLDSDALDAALLGLTTPNEPWGDVLLHVVEKRHIKWQREWQQGHFTAAQYELMKPMRELNQPELCRQMFENLLRLILPHGSLFARVAAAHNRTNKCEDTPDTAGPMMGAHSTDFHENLPVVMSASSMLSEQVGQSFFSTISSSGSRDLSFPRRVHSRNRNHTPSLAAKMLPPED